MAHWPLVMIEYLVHNLSLEHPLLLSLFIDAICTFSTGMSWLWTVVIGRGSICLNSSAILWWVQVYALINTHANSHFVQPHFKIRLNNEWFQTSFRINDWSVDYSSISRVTSGSSLRLLSGSSSWKHFQAMWRVSEVIKFTRLSKYNRCSLEVRSTKL